MPNDPMAHMKAGRKKDADEQNLIIELSARFLECRIKHDGDTRDTAYAFQCIRLAETIVKAARQRK